MQKDDVIYRQDAIDAVHKNYDSILDFKSDGYTVASSFEDIIDALPPAEPETYKEKLKEIADELSEKFAYMNTCPNERDIILGYLGVKRPTKLHCDTDCTDSSCPSNIKYNLPTIEPERKKGVWINDCCSICGYGVEPWNNTPYCPNCGADMKGE